MKKGFTLIELLAVIIVLGIVGMIAVGVVSNSINSSKKKTFEINANNLLDATKDYVTKYMENNDFPEDGIEATSESLEIKNNPFISGTIKRNEEGQVVLIDVSDGTYCANGTKSNMQIEEESCETIDDTPPTLKIKELKTTRNSSKIMIKTQDSGSGIKEYKYCIKKESEENYKEEDCELVEKNLEKGIVKEIITLENLEPDTTYEIKVTSKNGSNNEKNEETKKITIKTKEIEEPEFKISTTTYALTKKLTIIYPEVDGKYIKYYQVNESIPEKVIEQEKELEIKGNIIVKAYITNEKEDIIVQNTIEITGLDQEGPEVNVIISDLDKWTKEKEMTISATDEGVGLALKPYINNGYEEKYSNWNRENSVTLTSSGELNIKVRDRLGNVNQTFYLNGTECNVDTEDLCGINRIDSVAPRIEIKVIEGTTINNEKYKEWYNSDSVTVEIKVIDQYKYNNEVVDGGSGIKEDTLKIKVTNKVTSEQFTPTKIGENVYQIKLTKSGENIINVNVSDGVGNIGTKEKTVKIDNIVPLIKAKSNPLSLGNVDYKFTDNLNVTYGPTGGIAECDPATSLKTGTYTVKCKATGNNGKVATDATGLSFEVRHSYAAQRNVETWTENETYCKSHTCSYCVEPGGTCCNWSWDGGCNMTGGNCTPTQYCVNGDYSCGCRRGGNDGCCSATRQVTKSRVWYTCPNGGSLGDGTTGKESNTTCYY